MGRNRLRYKKQSAGGGGNTTIKTHKKNIHRGQYTTAAINAKPTQQPTGLIQIVKIERMRPAWEDGDNNNKATIPRGGDVALFVVMFCIIIDLNALK